MGAQKRKTPLAAVMAAFGLKPFHVVETAHGIAEEMGFATPSAGNTSANSVVVAHAPRREILLLLMIVRELTGYATASRLTMPKRSCTTRSSRIWRGTPRSMIMASSSSACTLIRPVPISDTPPKSEQASARRMKRFCL